MDRRSFFQFAALAAVAMAVVGCQSNTDIPFETAEAGDIGEYQLGPGDDLRVLVFGEDELSGEFSVDGSGKISMPLVGEMVASGLTVRELEQSITGALAQGYVRDPRVSVEVLNFRPFYILGEVNQPGQYSYVNGMTAVTAVAMAGGYTYRGRQDYILITRGRDPEKRERRASPNTLVYPDDVIRVPERFF